MTVIDEERVVVEVKGLTVERLHAWVRRGWVRPTLGEAGPVYCELDIARCELVRQLRDDMDLDRDTLSLVLSLTDQIYGLRRELRRTLRAIEQLPGEHRQLLADRLRAAENILDGDH